MYAIERGNTMVTHVTIPEIPLLFGGVVKGGFTVV